MVFNPETHPFCSQGYQYACDVAAGKIPNSLYLIGACKRFLSDLGRDEYPFDADYAEKYLRLVQKLHHVKGTWSSPHIHYEPWQNWAFMNLMGFQNPKTGFRRFRTFHMEVPRGAGKSLLASQALLYFLALDNPVGNEIAVAATKADQSRIVLDSARAMAKKSQSFLRATGVKVLAHKLVHEASNSSAVALSSDSKSLDGRQDVLCVIDELHAVSKEMFEVVSSGMSKRADSLLMCITTAGFNKDSIGYSQSTYAKKVALGETIDDTFLAIIYTADEGDDVFDEITWRKANPNYGVSVDPITFAAKAKKAQEMPADLNNFKVKHLNMWLNQATAFFSVEKWNALAKPAIKLEDFKGKPCRLGLDMSSKYDMTSIGILFRDDNTGIYHAFDKSFLPEATIQEAKSALYETSVAQGYLISTPGEVINHKVIRETILELKKQFKIIECLYDRYAATEISQNLSVNGVEMVEFAMTTANLSEPTKKLDALMREGKIYHNGSPLLSWCIGNVVCKTDVNDNVFPKKDHERLKIDAAIALIMALAGWIQEQEVKSIYQERGIRVL